MKRPFCWINAVKLALAVASFFEAAAPLLEAAEPRKPNVLFIAVDDLNHWVGYLGRIRRRSRRTSTSWPRAACGSRTATARRRCATRRAPR